MERHLYKEKYNQLTFLEKLYFMLDEIKSYENKNVMELSIEDKLNKSSDLYYKQLTELCGKIMDISNIHQVKEVIENLWED